MRIEYSRNCVDAFRRFFRDFNRLADGVAYEQYLRFESDPRSVAALAVVNQIVASPYGQRIPIDREQHFAQCTEVINLIEDMSAAILEDIENAAREKRIVVDEVIKIVITVCISLLGVAFVSRAQRMATARVDYALERTHKLSLAVQAFIPRPFLRLMAVDSILNLERGDQTQVGVTMLFCDIRNFTSISEKMSNEALFDWLQSHLKRMTTATEKHRGFIANYIGDAVSAIFLTAMDGVRCSIAMESSADAFAASLRAQNEDICFAVAVGLHSHLVGVGVLGNDKHHSCAIVSAEVNVAAQLEALSKEYGARIVVSAAVVDQLKPDEFSLRPLGRVRLSAESDAEHVLYDVYQADTLPNKTYKNDTLALWTRVLAHQDKEEYAAALPLLDQIEAIATARHIHDPSLKIKRGKMTPWDQHAFD